MIRQIFREANLPLPTEKVAANGRVKWGDDNLYPQFLNGLYSDNPIHKGIVDQKVKFITAGGIETANPDYIKNGTSAYDLNEVIETLVLDQELSNSFAVIYKRGLDGFWYANPCDYELVRAIDGSPYFEISDDWSKGTQGKNTGYKLIKSIMYVTPKDTECILYQITRPKQRKLNKKLTASFYPEPPYSGAITSIMAGIEMDYYTYSEVVNGYKGGAVISLLNGVPDSPEEEDAIIKRVKEDATDRDKQGGLTVLFADGKDRAPEISQLNGNDLDKRYIESNKEILRKIMIAHGVISPALFGVISESMFGSKEEMEVAYRLFQENYVKSKQSKIEDALNWAFKKLNKQELGLKFKDYAFFLNAPVPVEPVQPATFSKEIDVPSLFSAIGVERSTVTVLHSKPYESFEDNEAEFKEQFLAGRFEMNLTDDDRNILQMIKNGESYDSISKAIGKGGAYLSKRLFQLTSNGYLNEWNLTDKGQRASVVISEIEVLYSYELRPNAPALVAGGSSRPFCERMVQLDRLYTREEIKDISSQIKRDVWTYRGGWYHNPTTDVNTPSCRHLWKQNVIVR